MTWIQNRAPASAASGLDPSSRLGEGCPESISEICSESVTLQGAVDEVTLSSASVCVDMGYLCAELETTGSQRILRWPADTGRLWIRIPTPQGVAPDRARELQSAVVRGIQYWQRRPLELVIDTHPTPSGRADIEIAWGLGLSGSQLGLTLGLGGVSKGVSPSSRLWGSHLRCAAPPTRTAKYPRTRCYSRQPMRWGTPSDYRTVILSATSCIRRTLPATSPPATSGPWIPSTVCRTARRYEKIHRARRTRSLGAFNPLG